MEICINVPNVLLYAFVGWEPPGDDLATVIGDSRFAYLSLKDPGHVFLPAAKNHDDKYVKGSIWQLAPRWISDKYFLDEMLLIAREDIELTKDAMTLYLLVREYCKKWWEGTQ